MQFTSNAWFADRIRGSGRFDDKSIHQLIANKTLNILNIEMSESTMPESEVQWACTDQSCELCHGYSLSVKEGSIVGGDCGGEQEFSVAMEVNAIRPDSDNVAFLAR
jgi:hypothetical protein